MVEDGGTMIVINSTVIKDAQNAVFVMPDGKLDISEATLDRNYIGINIPHLNNGLINVTGTTFSCTGCLTGISLKQSSTGYLGNVTRAGMIINDGFYSIGNAQSGTNTFKELYRGIESHSSICKIANTTFENFPSQNEYIELPTDPGGGIAIYASNTPTGTMSITGLGIGTASPVIFTNCF